MSLKHMVLGLIRENPAYGYSIIQTIACDFAEQGPEINKGQLYTLIDRLEKEGLIVRETIPQENSPNRKLINITPLGEEDFFRWLESDEGEMDTIRYDFFGKYGFLYKVKQFDLLAKEKRLKKLMRQLDLMRDKLDNFLQARETMLKKGVSMHRIHILEYGIEIQKTKIKWLEKIYHETVNEE